MRPPRRRWVSIAWLLVACTAVPALVWTTGIRVEQLLLVVGVSAATVAVVRFRPRVADVAWPAPAVLAPDRGVRREVARLSWTVGRGGEGQVGSASVRRLRQVAARRLGRLGVSLDDPAGAARVRALLGEGPWQVLSAPPGSSTVSPAAFRTAVLAVEHLPDPRTAPTDAGDP